MNSRGRENSVCMCVCAKYLRTYIGCVCRCPWPSEEIGPDLWRWPKRKESRKSLHGIFCRLLDFADFSTLTVPKSGEVSVWIAGGFIPQQFLLGSGNDIRSMGSFYSLLLFPPCSVARERERGEKLGTLRNGLIHCKQMTIYSHSAAREGISPNQQEFSPLAKLKVHLLLDFLSNIGKDVSR